MDKDKGYNAAMWVITTVALVLLLGGLIAAIWGAVGWGTYGRTAVSAVLGWLLLAVVAGLAFGQGRKSR